MTDINTGKICSKADCNNTGPFYKNARKKSGLDDYCKACRTEVNHATKERRLELERIDRERNPEKFRARARKRYADPVKKGPIVEKLKRYYQKNKVEINKKQSEYFREVYAPAHPEKVKEWRKNSYEKRREELLPKMREYSKKWHAKKHALKSESQNEV